MNYSNLAKEDSNPFEEAFFIKFDGSPLRKNIPSANDSLPVPPLVQLDLRFDLLRVFLEHMQKAVNQHAEIINNIQKDVKYRATEICLSDYFSRIASGLHKDWGERPHSLRLTEEGNKHYQNEDSPALKKAVDKLMGKMEVISTHLINTSTVLNLSSYTIL